MENKVKKSTAQPAVIVEVMQEKCKGCEVCVAVCPKGCLRLDQSIFNSKGFHPSRYNYHGFKGDCTACGLCYMVCPDYAVRTIKVRKQKR